MKVNHIGIILVVITLFLSKEGWSQISSLPYFENFESDNGGYISGGNNSSWEHGVPSGTTINSAFSGDNAWVTNLDGFGNDNEDSYLESPIFDFSDLSEDPVLSFVSNYSIFVDAGNQMLILLSVDGGMSYTTLGDSEDFNWYNNERGFIGESNGYRQFSHTLDGTAGFADVRIRFASNIGIGSTFLEGVALDDIGIVAFNDFADLAITNSNLPIVSPFFTDSENLELTIENLGGMSLTLGEIVIMLEGPNGIMEEFAETVDISFSGGETKIVTLSNSLNLSQPGNYNIVVSLGGLMGDEVIENNTLVINTGRIDVYDESLPFVEDFESANGGIQGNIAAIPGLQSATHLTTDTERSISFVFDPDFQSKRARISARPLFETVDLIFTLDLNSYNVAEDRLRLSVTMAGASFAQEVNNRIFIRGNADQAWLELFNWGAEITSDEIPQNLSLANISEVLMTGGQQYGEAFQLRIGHQDNGFLELDNIIIEEIPKRDVRVVSGDVPNIGPLLGNNETLSIEVENAGLQEIANIQVNASIHNPLGSEMMISEVINSTLQPGEVLVYNFTTPADFSLLGDYQIDFSTSLLDDGSSFNNDLLTISTGNADIFIGELPFVEDFEDSPSFTDSGLSAEIPGLPFAYFDARSSFGFRIENDSDFETQIASLTTFNSLLTSDLVFTLNLLDFDVNIDNLNLEVSLAHQSTNPVSPNNRIFIRGDIDQSWLELLNWSVEVPSNGIPEDLLLPNLSQVLMDGDQQYGETFQIRFGHQGFGNLQIDDVVISIVNSMPILTDPIADQILNEGFVSKVFNLDEVFEDADADILMFETSSNNVSVVTTNISGSILTLSEVGIGITEVNISADDGRGGFITTSFIVNVEEAENNVPEVEELIPDQELIEGFSSLSIDLSAVFTDVDQDDLIFNALSSDPAVVMVTVFNTTLTITEEGVGTSIITLTADDRNNGIASLNFSVSVDRIIVPENNAPIISDITNQSLSINGILEIEFTVDDIDGDNLTVFASSDNQLVITDSGLEVLGEDDNRSLVINPVADQTGETNITVTVSDGELSSSTTFSVSISAVPQVTSLDIEPNIDPIGLFPNPSNGVISISSSKFEVSVPKFELYNLSGEQVLFNAQRVNSSDFSLNIRTLNSGVYFLIIEIDGVKLTKRVIRD